MGVLDLGALAEQRVRLVEEQDRRILGARVEDCAQVLLGLADVLADDLREVDAVEVELQLGSDIWAAIVLPPPGSPVKSALRPVPRGKSRRASGFSQNSARSCAS